MTKTVRPKVNYRKIYEQHHGPIPVDKDGRNYEIHHIDGNPSNNDPSNLIALTIQKHFDTHFEQGDWWACMRIAQKMKFSPKQISEYSKQCQLDRIQAGTHNFLGGDIPRKSQRKRVAEGTHQWLGESNPVYQQLADGTHNFLGGEIQRKHNRRRVSDGTHHLLSGAIQRTAAYQALAAGTHPSQVIRTCTVCGKVGKGTAMKRWHFDNCKDQREADAY